jgi:hypothetical protein
MPRNYRVEFFLDPDRIKEEYPGYSWMRASRMESKGKPLLLVWHDQFVQELKSNPSDVSVREDLESICSMVPHKLKSWKLRTAQWNERPDKFDYSIFRNCPSSKPPFSDEVVEQIVNTTLNTLDSKELFSAALEALPETPSSQILEQTGIGWVRYGLSLGDK